MGIPEIAWGAEMMLYLYVQQHQWIAATLLAGVALTLVFCLVYQDMWRPREEESQTANSMKITGIGSFLRWVLSFTPWAVILVLIVSIAYTITQIIQAASRPPNW